jgi:hypothetical protein
MKVLTNSENLPHVSTNLVNMGLTFNHPVTQGGQSTDAAFAPAKPDKNDAAHSDQATMRQV